MGSGPSRVRSIIAATVTNIVVIGLVLQLIGWTPLSYAAAPLQGGPPATVRLIVKVAKGLTLAQAQAVIRGHGATPKAAVSQLDIHIVEVPANAADAIAKAMKADAEIQRVESDQ